MDRQKWERQKFDEFNTRERLAKCKISGEQKLTHATNRSLRFAIAKVIIR